MKQRKKSPKKEESKKNGGNPKIKKGSHFDKLNTNMSFSLQSDLPIRKLLAP